MGRVIVTGAGPAGMTAAIHAARAGARVLLLEKNHEAGKKLLLTGGGRCNLTNTLAGEQLEIQYPGAGGFLYSAFAQFGPAAICAFFRELGMNLRVEEEGRVFPRSGGAASVREVLLEELRRRGVEILYDREVRKILLSQGRIRGVEAGEEYAASQVILATGGASYPATGATGAGYALAKSVGHKVSPLKPALASLLVNEQWLHSLSGVSLSASCRLRLGKKTVTGTGELLFTHFGLSGPLALNLSRYLEPGMQLQLNLLPQQNKEELFSPRESTIGQRLSALLPHRLSKKLLELAGIEPGLRALSRAQRTGLAELVFALPVKIAGIKPLGEAMVTCGGVELREVAPQTMASKLIPGLFFAGELLDLDGISGGYNLTVAFATGAVAGAAAGGL